VLVRAGRDRALLNSENHLFVTMCAGRELGTYQVELSSKMQMRKINGSSCLSRRLGRKALITRQADGLGYGMGHLRRP
jgi:hypothetical protein